MEAANSGTDDREEQSTQSSVKRSAGDGWGKGIYTKSSRDGSRASME
jgi:hypothetical protein